MGAARRLADLVYWGRTTWFMNECWKDYEVYFDDAKQPAARGTFQMVHGPQRVKFAKTRASKVTFKFLNSYGGFNPGALEIQAFGRRLSDADLAQLAAEFDASQTGASGLFRADPQHLGRLIARLRQDYGARYPQAADHAARLDQLEKARKGPDKTGTGTLENLNSARSSDDRREPVPVLSGPMNTPGTGDAAEELSDKLEHQLGQLAREVLAFDLDKVLVIQRHEIEASHVYTYHYEGFRAGGGMYVVSLRRARRPNRAVFGRIAHRPDPRLRPLLRRPTILFSWRQKQDEGYHLWTIHADGAGLTQFTTGPWHDYNACWLPDGGIAFLSTRNPAVRLLLARPGGRAAPHGADGSQCPQAFGQLSQRLHSQRAGRRADHLHAVGIRRPAGDSHPESVDDQSRRHWLWPAISATARSRPPRSWRPGPFPATTKIICTMTGHNGPTRGAIGHYRPRQGDECPGVDRQHHARRAHSEDQRGLRQLRGDQAVQLSLSVGRLAVHGLREGAGAGSHLLPVMPSHRPSGTGERHAVFLPQPIRPRRRPPTIGSAMVDADPAAREERFATLVLQDVYNGLEPWVRRGEVKTLRVVREMPKTVRIDPGLRAFGFQFPVISCGATYAGKNVLGDVPVEPDGSACFRVPCRDADLLHGPGRARPGSAADAELHASYAGRSTGMHRLP